MGRLSAGGYPRIGYGKPSLLLLLAAFSMATIASECARADEVFGQLPKTSMEPPIATPEELASRLLTGDLSNGTPEGATSLTAKRDIANPPPACGTRSQCLQKVMEQAAQMPNTVWPPELSNIK